MTGSPILAAVSNRVWRLASLGAHARFRRALETPGEAQRALLRRTLADNARTVYGRAHGFAEILTAPDLFQAFQERVPPVAWDDLEPWIERARRGEPGVLTAEPVQRLVPSSGSTAARKLVPWTKTLAGQFRDALGAWVVDLFDRHPQALDGPAYWSVSPAVPPEPSSDDAVPVDFDDDEAYLGPLARRLARATRPVPGVVCRIRNMETFRYVTLLRLVATRDLALVSVWHPSFWTLLLEALPRFRDRLVHDLARGALSPPSRLPPHLHQTLARGLAPDPARAHTIRHGDLSHPPALWPRLALLSAWGDGPATPAFRDLAARHLGIACQPKGLFATEAFVTLPIRGAHPLAVSSHVFELVDAEGRSHFVGTPGSELETGRTYTILVTTGGGLYRYRLGDRVRVEGFLGATPSLRFLGKEDRVSDRVGEKLSEGFVAQVLDRLDLPPGAFVLLAPEASESDPVGYVLYLDAEPVPGDLARALDAALCENPHYRWARDLGQLAPARAVPVGSGAHERYVERQRRLGQRLGAVKPAVLSAKPGWGKVLS